MENIRNYIEEALNKKIYSFHKLDGPLFGDTYVVNDAYYFTFYEQKDINELSLERMESVYEIITPLKISEKLLFIDTYHKIKATKVIHGGRYFESEPSFLQVRNFAKKLKKLHKNVSENDMPLNLEKLFYQYKERSEDKLPKVYENRIVREFNLIKDKTPIGLCHNYLSKSNVIYRDDDCFLLNYELSNINYIYFDLAFYIYENELSEETKIEFLKAYFKAKYNTLKKSRIEIFIRFLQGFLYYFYQYLSKLTDNEKYLKLTKSIKDKIDLYKKEN